MRVSGVERLELARAEAWGRLTDLERLGAALPGCQAVNVEDDERFTAAFRPATGLGVTPVRMAFRVLERSEPDRLHVRGTGGGAEYAVTVDARLELADEGGGTAVRWTADVGVAGVLRSIAQRVLGGIVADQVAEVLRVARDGGAATEGLDAGHAEAVAGRGATTADVADPERYEGGPGW